MRVKSVGADVNDLVLDSGPPTARIRHHLETEENRSASLRRIKVFKLCERQSRAGVPDRRTEDCEEGAQGKPAEEALAGVTEG
ncbi:MAG: hypothetical protein Q9173_006332, partial [Seirophora scorigena]